MKGARDYASLFETGQHGRLYIRSHYHARGKIFHIYVLPEGEKAIPNGPNAPLNKDAVEVYGVVDGNRGWTESYGWLHHGKWVDDFELLVTQKMFERCEQEALRNLAEAATIKADTARKLKLLESY